MCSHYLTFKNILVSEEWSTECEITQLLTVLFFFMCTYLSIYTYYFTVDDNLDLKPT